MNEGRDRAAGFLAREAALAGLTPAGDSGGWFQTLHLFARRLSPESRILVGDSVLIPVRDFKVFPVGRGQPRPIAGAYTVYGGIVGDSSTQIGAQDAAGRVVVLGVPPDMTAQQVYRNVSYSSDSRFGKAIAVVIASLDFLEPAQRAITTSVGQVNPASQPATAVPSSILVTRKSASLMLGTEIGAATVGMLGKTLGGVLVVNERDNPTRNVVGVLRGSDARLSSTYVALGAHSDHLGLSVTPPPTAASAHRDSIYNGADDDGSGSVALIEVAHIVASGRRPARSILFVWHTAEEDGLLGSKWFVEHPSVPLDSILAQLNLDMVGRGSAADVKGGGPRFLQVLGSTKRSPELWSTISQVNAQTGLRFDIDTIDANGVYCRSDHWNYARFGIPIAFLTTGTHADYHALTDEAQKIDYDKLAAVTRLTVDIVEALANRHDRLPLIGPAPDPRTFCRG